MPADTLSRNTVVGGMRTLISLVAVHGQPSRLWRAPPGRVKPSTLQVMAQASSDLGVPVAGARDIKGDFSAIAKPGVMTTSCTARRQRRPSARSRAAIGLPTVSGCAR